ncbi:MAG: glycosyltransferase family 4 protein [Thermoplasmatota archaeon]
MRILVLQQFHPFAKGGGAARFSELARHWTASGHEVTILTSNIEHQTGRVASGYARSVTKESDGGVTVERLSTLQLDKRRRGGRIARDLSFAVHSARRGAKGPRPDVVIASSPPLFTGHAGVHVARAHRVPLVFDVRDLWPDAAVQMGALTGPAAKVAYRLEGRLYRFASHVVAATPGFRQAIVAKGVPEDKVTTIPNGADMTLFCPGPMDPTLRHRLGWDGRIVVTYAGVHGPAQALDQVVAAARTLQAEPLLFAFFGDGTEKPTLVDSAKGLSNVQFHDPVPRALVPGLLRSSDVALVPLRRLETFRDTLPAKAFEILGCGVPLVAAAEGALAELVERSGGGLSVPPEVPMRLAEALRGLVSAEARVRLQGRGAVYVRAHYDRAHLASAYLQVLARAVARG